MADEQMVRRLLLSFATLAAAMFVAATPAWANDSGNFHLMAGGELACHWASFGGVGTAWATSGLIRCERYNDHTLVEMTRTGRIIVKKHYRGWVAPGGRVHVRHFLWISHRANCSSLRTIWNTYSLSCSYLRANGTAVKSFTIEPTGPVGIQHY